MAACLHRSSWRFTCAALWSCITAPVHAQSEPELSAEDRAAIEQSLAEDQSAPPPPSPLRTPPLNPSRPPPTPPSRAPRSRRCWSCRWSPTSRWPTSPEPNLQTGAHDPHEERLQPPAARARRRRRGRSVLPLRREHRVRPVRRRDRRGLRHHARPARGPAAARRPVPDALRPHQPDPPAHLGLRRSAVRARPRVRRRGQSRPRRRAVAGSRRCPGTSSWSARSPTRPAKAPRAASTAAADLASSAARLRSTLAAIKQFFALSDDWSLALGLSARPGPNSTGRDNRSDVYGRRPLPEVAADHASRAIRSWRCRASGSTAAARYPRPLLQDVSGYAQLVSRFAQRWAAAARYEYGCADAATPTSSPRLDPSIPSGPSRAQRVAAAADVLADRVLARARAGRRSTCREWEERSDLGGVPRARGRDRRPRRPSLLRGPMVRIAACVVARCCSPPGSGRPRPART